MPKDKGMRWVHKSMLQRRRKFTWPQLEQYRAAKEALISAHDPRRRSFDAKFHSRAERKAKWAQNPQIDILHEQVFSRFIFVILGGYKFAQFLRILFYSGLAGLFLITNIEAMAFSVAVKTLDGRTFPVQIHGDVRAPVASRASPLVFSVNCEWFCFICEDQWRAIRAKEFVSSCVLSSQSWPRGLSFVDHICHFCRVPQQNNWLYMLFRCPWRTWRPPLRKKLDWFGNSDSRFCRFVLGF